MSEPWGESILPCADPECPGSAEPEEDDDFRYWTCDTCGYVFGFHPVPSGTDSSCQLGVPEDVRRKASVPARSGVVDLGPVIRRRTP